MWAEVILLSLLKSGGINVDARLVSILCFAKMKTKIENKKVKAMNTTTKATNVRVP